MSVKVKPPLFITTPNDSLVVVDVYGGSPTPNEPTNLLDAIGDNIGNSLTKALGINASGLKIFKKAADLVLSDKKLSGEDFAKEMLGEIFPNAKASLKALKGGLINSLTQSIGISPASAISAYRAVKDGDYQDILGNLAKTDPLAKFVVNGQEVIKKAKDIDSLGDLFNVAGDIFGNETLGKVLKLDKEFGAFKSLVDTAITLRVPELADYLIDKVDDTSKDKLTRAAGIQAAKSGDANALYSYAYRMNVAEALNEEPELMGEFVKNYSFPNEQGPTIEATNMLTSILDEMQPDWKGEVNGKSNLNIWLEASPAIKQLIYADGRYSKLIAAAENLKPRSLNESINRTMPWLILKEDNSLNLV